MPLLSDKKSAIFHKKDIMSLGYTIRLRYPKIYANDDLIAIFFYRNGRTLNGFSLRFNDNIIGKSYVSIQDLSNSFKIPPKYCDVYYEKDDKNWPTYWVVIHDPRYPRVYLMWEPLSQYDLKGLTYDKGQLEVMLLPKDANQDSRERFAYYLAHIDKKAKKIAPAIRMTGSIFNPFGGSFSLSEFAKSLPSDNNTKGIQIKYQGRNSNDHYVYNLYYNGSYDGQIFYYPNNSGYTIMTVGLKHGQSVNGNFANGRLYTPQCGHTQAENINDAIKKSINCSYKSRY